MEIVEEFPTDAVHLVIRSRAIGVPPGQQDNIVGRLQRIEELLLPTDDQLSSVNTTPTPRQSVYAAAAPIVEASPQHSASSFTANQVITPPSPPYTIFGYSLDGFSRLGLEPCPAPLLPLCSNDTEEELELELFSEEALFGGPQTNIELCDLDLGSRRCWQLEQTFSRDVLPWCPIIEHRECSDLVTRVAEGGFDTSNPRTSLVLFMLALGAFAKESHYTSARIDSLPGLDYFRAACQILDRDRASRHTLMHVQGKILTAFYLLFCLKPIHAFEAIHSASSELLILLQLRGRHPSDSIYQEKLNRAYWTCYLIEHELQPYVSYSSRLLQSRRDFVPLPLSDYDEPGMYWFLSEITLRGIICSFSTRDGSMGPTAWNPPSFAPKLIEELASQMAEWHANLARPIRFFLDSPTPSVDITALRPLLDPHKVFLRAQYYAVHATLHWPSVVQLLNMPRVPEPQDTAAGDMSPLSVSAAKSVQYSVLHVYAVESLLQERHLMLFANITGLFCITMLLLCIYELPELAEIQHPRIVDAVILGWRCLRIWDDEPNVKSRLRRVEDLMKAKGIEVPVENMYI